MRIFDHLSLQNLYPSHLNTLLNTLDIDSPGEDTRIEPVLHEMAERIKKRGLVIIISDLFDDPENIMNGLKHLGA